jgi:protein subunit release factor A
MKFKSFNVAELTSKRAQLRTLKEEIAFLQATIKVEREFERVARETEKAQKIAQRESKKAERIAKLEARLAKMKNPKRAGKVTVFTGADAQKMAA